MLQVSVGALMALVFVVFLGTALMALLGHLVRFHILQKRFTAFLRETYTVGYAEGAMEYMVWSQAKLDLQDSPTQERIKVATARYFAGILNEALAIDPVGINKLFSTRVPTHATMCDHPSIVVSETDGFVTLSPLGIINGLLPNNVANYKVAAMTHEKTGEIKEFRVMDMDTNEILTATPDVLDLNLKSN